MDVAFLLGLAALAGLMFALVRGCEWLAEKRS